MMEAAEQLVDLPLLTDAERRKQLIKWNDTKAEYPLDWCVHELFEAQVGRTPDAVAVVFQEQHLTYNALNRRANQLAHFLQALDVRPEVLVGVYMERSVEMVMSLLGVLKAGGAYVPLDPAYPKARLTFMLQDSQPSVLLTQERLTAALPEHSAQVVCPDTHWKVIARESETNPVNEVTADNLAYVIYTSGSTGRPKGVLVPHRGLCNVSETQIQIFGVKPDDHVLQFASLNFDASVFEVLMALRVGATLCLGTREELLPGPNLLQRLQELSITIFTLTPSALAALPAEELVALQTVTVAGEACPATLVTRWAEGRRFFNLYGPTEASIWTTAAQCTDGSHKPTIGRPIANTQVYLLDAHLHPTPIGTPGELHIGGIGLARGYLNQPRLTAEKFIPNPFGEEPGARLYKTGDLARYLPDGNIDFVGRLDQQVKVRGFRIELGEIEAVLVQQPRVREAVVLVREDIPGNKQLVAYVAPDDTGQRPSSVARPLSSSELRRHLKQRLPEHMLPSAFVMLEALPLTPNDKVDRRALPPPPRTRPELEQVFVAPRNPIEQALASIWSDVLQLEGVGVHDNFFELGGQSLLATQVVSRLNQVFRVEIPLPVCFERPTIVGLAQEIARHEKSAQRTLPIEPVAKDGALPLSFAQQRLWFIDQLLPNSPLYNVPSVFHIAGALDVAMLERCLEEIVRRHETLRATFQEIDGQPVQIISPPRPIRLTLLDLRSLPDQERQSRARQLMREQARRPFDLAHGLLLRAVLVHLEDQVYRLLLTIHHIVFDGWSAGVIMNEIGALYEAFSKGRPSPLPELPIQYADFAHWQRRYLQSQVLDEHLDYWKAQFSDGPPTLALPTDRPRPTAQTYRGTRQSRPLPTPLVDALETLSRQAGASLFMTMLAAFQTLLYRYSGQTDIVVSIPIANRNRPEVENLVGFFVNTLPLRGDLSGHPTFREHLERVRQIALGAYAHQDLPLEKLIQALKPGRDLSYNPLLQVMFVMQNMPTDVIQLPDVRISLVEELDTGTAKFDLTLFVEFLEQRPVVAVEYNTDLFEAATIRRMLGHFQTLLESVVANPEGCIAQLPLLTQAERRQLLYTWNATEADFPGDARAHTLFEAQVERTPDAIALTFGKERVVYRELNRRANQLGHYLQKLGVGPEVRVAICMERSIEMIVGLLGVLKAGGAYVPLDPTYPKERLAFMLQDARAPILLTREWLLEQLSFRDVQTLCLDSAWRAIIQESGENPNSGATPENLAYAIYTSGSTGKPKGVLIPHRGLVNYLTWCQRAYPLGVGQGAPLHSRISFDLTITSLFAPLLAGRPVHVLPQDLGVDLLSTALRDETDYSLIKITPAHLELLSQQLPAEEVAGRARAFVIGGENLLARHITFWQDHAPNTLLVNEYGPTETVVGCCVYRVPLGEHRTGSVPIGWPISNTQIYLLDAHLRLVPVGVPGELHIGGVGVARGYLNRPALSAEKFIPNPFSSEPGARLFKTGDLACCRSDGNIEFLGRIDHQVKIRGFRIELGEIESVLGAHPGVQDAVALAWGDETAPGQSGDKKLVAYVVLDQETKPTPRQLRGFMREHLPEYMIPSAFIVLDALPLTANGKIDRRALPPPERDRIERESAFVAPSTPFEEILAEIWEEVLEKKISVHDDFFDLGGHSLLATQVVSRVRDRFEIELPVRSLFETRTVAAMGLRVEQILLDKISALDENEAARLLES